MSAATSFLFSLASNRTKTTFMPIVGFINGCCARECGVPSFPRPFPALLYTSSPTLAFVFPAHPSHFVLPLPLHTFLLFHFPLNSLLFFLFTPSLLFYSSHSFHY
jgi:hypothetical protein